MITRLVILVFLALAPTTAVSDAQTVRDRIVRELRDDGYAEIRITRTFLGRMRFVASDRERRREIVVNPRTGVILRDYVRFLIENSGSGKSGSGGSGAEEDDDEDDDDEDDDDRDDDDESDDGEDDENNSGSSSDDDDDDDDDDNSGSGSSSSGSGSSGSDSDDDD